jgi:hypothetical protein
MAAEGYGEHGQPAERRADAEIPVVVHSCSRLGLTANPPGRRLIGRWRR